MIALRLPKQKFTWDIRFYRVSPFVFIELEEQRNAAKHTSQELEKAVDYFKDRLGLQLKKVSG